MDLSQLPQNMIDTFLNYKNDISKINSTWIGDFSIISVSKNPYFRYSIKNNKYVYKIFYETELNYNIIQTFTRAKDRGFFDDITIIDKFIKYNNEIIGYVYPLCEIVSSKFKMKRTINKMTNLFDQPEKFKILYRKLCDKIKETKIAYTDLYPSNIVKYQDNYYLIDLDSLIDLRDTSVKEFHNKYGGSTPDFYSKFINKILYKQNIRKKIILDKIFENINYDFIDKTKFKNMKILTFNDLKNKIDPDYLDLLVYDYIKKNKNTFIVNVWPVTNGGNNIIEKYYSRFSSIIYYKEIKLNPLSYKNYLEHISDKRNHSSGERLWFAKPHSDNNPLKIFVIETYPNELDISNNQIRNYLIDVFNNNSKYIDNVKNSGINNLRNLYITTKNKRECRLELSRNNKVPKILQEKRPFNYSHHVNDLHQETIDIAKLVLNNNTLNILHHLQWDKLPGFNSKFNSFKNFLNKYKINTDNILIYNSSVLAPLGLREPNDIDFIQINSKLIQQNKLPKDIDIQNKYFERGYMILKINNEKYQYMEDNPSYGKNIHIKNMEYTLSLKDIVFNPKNYYYYKGIKFMSIDLFKKVKSIRGRKKDLDQIKILETHLKS